MLRNALRFRPWGSTWSGIVLQHDDTFSVGLVSAQKPDISILEHFLRLISRKRPLSW